MPLPNNMIGRQKWRSEADENMIVKKGYFYDQKIPLMILQTKGADMPMVFINCSQN